MCVPVWEAAHAHQPSELASSESNERAHHHINYYGAMERTLPVHAMRNERRPPNFWSQKAVQPAVLAVPGRKMKLPIPHLK